MMRKIIQTYSCRLSLRTLFAGCLLFFATVGFAQQQPGFFHSAVNPFLLNPAFAGEAGGQNLYLVGRADFINIPYAPRFYHLTFDAALANPRVGFGVNAFSNTIFAVRNIGFSGSYRYKFQIAERHFLSTALSAGFVQNSLDFSRIIANDPSEISDFIGVESNMRLNFHLGILYQFSQLRIGLSAHNALSPNFLYEKSVNEQTLNFRLLQHYHISASYKQRFGNRWAVDMMLLAGSAHGLPLWGRLGAIFHYDDMFWVGGGVGLRTQTFFIAGVRLGEQITFSYSYGFSIAAGRNYRANLGGSHEFTIGYRIQRRGGPVRDQRLSQEIDQLHFIVESQGQEIDRLRQERLELRREMAQFQIDQTTIDSLKNAIMQAVAANAPENRQPENLYPDEEVVIDEPAEFEERFYVVIAASRTIADVNQFQRLVLRNFGIDTRVLDPNPPFRSYFFIYTNVFATMEEAQNAIRELEKTGISDYIVGNIWIHQSTGGGR